MLLCRLALGGAQLLTPEGDTGGFMSFQTLGSCFINLQYFSIGTHVGCWLSQATVTLLQGHGVGFAGCIAVPARLTQSFFRTPSNSYQLMYSPARLWISRPFKAFCSGPNRPYLPGFLVGICVLFYCCLLVVFPVPTAVRLLLRGAALLLTPASFFFVLAEVFVCSQLRTDLGVGLV